MKRIPEWQLRDVAVECGINEIEVRKMFYVISDVIQDYAIKANSSPYTLGVEFVRGLIIVCELIRDNRKYRIDTDR